PSTSSPAGAASPSQVSTRFPSSLLRVTTARRSTSCSSPPSPAARRRKSAPGGSTTAARMNPGCERSVVRLRHEPRLDLAAAADVVDEIHGLVLPVGAGDPEPHRGPAPEAEASLLCDRAREDDRPADDFVIDATL